MLLNYINKKVFLNSLLELRYLVIAKTLPPTEIYWRPIRWFIQKLAALNVSLETSKMESAIFWYSF